MKRLLLLLCVSCSQGDPGTSGAGSDEGPALAPGHIAIPDTVRRNLGLTFAKAEVRPLVQTLPVPGSFELMPKARRAYHLPMAGELRLEVGPLETVEAGAVLFHYRSIEWSERRARIAELQSTRALTEAEGAEVQARVERHEQRIAALGERLSGLQAAKGATAQLEAELALEEAEASVLQVERESNAAQLASATAAYQLARELAAADFGLPTDSLDTYLEGEWLPVHAAEKGTVEGLHLSAGAFAESAAPVLSVVNLERVRLRAVALQADLDLVLAAESGELRLEQRSATANLQLGLEADASARTAILYATPDRHEPWMRPGVSCTLHIEVARSQDAVLVLPRKSVVKDGVQHVFFRRDPEDPDLAIRVEADLGLEATDWIEVRSGIRVGDEVVLDGVYELNLASAMQPAGQAGGHFHADGTFHGEH